MIQYHFLFDEDFLVAAFRQYRKQRPSRHLLVTIKGIGLLLTVGVAALCINHGKWEAALIFTAFALLILVGSRIDDWLIRRRFRKSPYQNEDMMITLSEKGFHAIGSKSNSALDWSAFTKARYFSNGVLLFQGPGVFNWLPDMALTGSSPESTRELVASHVDDCKSI